MKLEVCAGTFESALNAQAAGADRIELCRDLHLDGLTPYENSITTVLERLSIPVFILVRPRAGNFIYSEEEFKEMRKTIEKVKSMGCHGIVSGVINSNNSIDLNRTAKLIEWAYPLPFTFHRAFDLISDKAKAVDELSEIGAKRILTSGGKKTAVEGIEILEALNEQAEKNLIIMPGGGVRPDQVDRFKMSGFDELHSSARPLITDMNNFDEIHSDRSIIRQFKAGMRA